MHIRNWSRSYEKEEWRNENRENHWPIAFTERVKWLIIYQMKVDSYKGLRRTRVDGNMFSHHIQIMLQKSKNCYKSETFIIIFMEIEFKKSRFVFYRTQKNVFISVCRPYFENFATNHIFIITKYFRHWIAATTVSMNPLNDIAI